MISAVLQSLRCNILVLALVAKCSLLSNVSTTIGAENDAGKAVVDSTKSSSESASTVPNTDPLYSDDKPEWVATPDVLTGNIHRVSFSTELLESEEACREQIDKVILEAARQYVNQHVIAEPVAHKLSALNASWVRENWLVPNREWVAVLDRPSGTYHQLWGQLEIFPEDRQKVAEWYHDLDIRRRSLLCLFLSLSVGGLAGATNMGLRFWKQRMRT
jgi:hypothetical protein